MSFLIFYAAKKNLFLNSQVHFFKLLLSFFFQDAGLSLYRPVNSMLSDHYNNTVCQGHVKWVKETAQLRPPIQKPESNHCIPGWPYSHNLLTILHAFYFLRSPELLRDKCFRYPISIIKITLPWLKYFEKICNLKNQKTKRTLAIIPWAVLHSFPLSLFFFSFTIFLHLALSFLFFAIYLQPEKNAKDLKT